MLGELQGLCSVYLAPFLSRKGSVTGNIWVLGEGQSRFRNNYIKEMGQSEGLS